MNETRADGIVALSTLPLFYGGMLTQLHPDYFPELLRDHLTNLTDVPEFAAGLNFVSIMASGRSRPAAAAGIVFAMGVAWEIYQAYTGDSITLYGASHHIHKIPHALDWGDIGCYAFGGAAYTLLRKTVLRAPPSP